MPKNSKKNRENGKKAAPDQPNRIDTGVEYRKKAGSGGRSSNMIRQKSSHLHYVLQLLITDLMLRSTDEQKELFKKTFPSLPYKLGMEQALMNLATSRTTTDHTLFLVMSFMEDNKLMRTFGFTPPPPAKPPGKGKIIEFDYAE